MKIAGADVASIEVSHAGAGVLALAGLPPFAFRLAWDDDANMWRVEGDMVDDVRADLLEWARREVGQLYMNGARGACPTKWSA